MIATSPVQRLKPSSSVELLIKQDSGDPLLLKTLVEHEVENGFLRVIAPTVQGKTYLFDGARDIDVQFSALIDGQNKIVSLPCRFHRKFRSEDFSLVELEVVGDATMVQRRSAFRVSFNETFAYDYGEDSGMLITKDLSLKGMMACTTKKMEADEVIVLHWDKSPESEPFPITGKILSCKKVEGDKPYEIRVSFDPLDDKHQQALLAYLFKKQSEVLQGDVELMEKLWRESERKHADSPEAQMTAIFSLISVVLLAVSLVFYMLAAPATSSVLDNFLSTTRVALWKRQELTVSFILCLVAVLFAVVSIGAKFHYYRQGKYRFTLTPFLLLGVSLTGFAYLLHLLLNIVALTG